MKLHLMHPKDLFRTDKFYNLLLNSPYYFEKKYDGVRCVSWIDGDLRIVAYDKANLAMYSRNGKELTQLIPFFRKQLKIPKGFALDGELFLRDFSTTMSLVMSEHVSQYPDYYLFDIVPVDTVLKGKVYRIGYEKRKQELKRVVSKCGDKVRFIETEKSNFKNRQQIDNLIDKLIGKGFEGCVFKLSGSPYVPKRSLYWLKGKKVFTLDLKVVNVIASKEHPGQVQAIVCNLGKLNQPVGSGLTLKQRIEWYQHPEEIIGKIVEVKFVEYTKLGYLRQPTFVRIRTDKSVPDI